MEEHEIVTRKLASIVMQISGSKQSIDSVWPLTTQSENKVDRIVITQEMRDEIIAKHGLDPKKFKPIS